MQSQMSNRVSQLLLGEDFVKFLGSVNVLLIGVGGIGCEVLKVLTQFQLQSLHILDLDTIEVSNLNRQFLFRKHHRGLYKAHVAKEVLTKDYPHLKIESYSSNIRDAQFGLKFFRKFQIVIMALDNQETRSFVNKQCMIADIPLIDAGTTGYKGQSFLLKRGETRCYDCFPRSENKKSYPACTIRTLPEKPVHCIIWAKYLFTVLFSGELEEGDDSNLLSDIAQQIPEGNHSNHERGAALFKSIFETDVLRQKEGEENVKFQHLIVLKREQLLEKLETQSSPGQTQLLESIEAALEYQCQLVEKQHKANNNNNNHKSTKYLNREDLQFLQTTHPVEVYMQIFIDSFERLAEEKTKSGCVPFEKDDNIIMKFITAACNLRCVVFGLPCQTQFQVKEVAGSIVPAIASTNSIVSGIEITETFKYLQRQFFKQGDSSNNQQSSRKSLNSRELYIQNDLKTKVLDVNPGKNNEECLSCNVNLLPCIIECDYAAVNLGQFIAQVINHIKKNDGEDNTADEEDNESEDDGVGKAPKLKDYSISFGQYILYEDSEDMDEDEIELNIKKQTQTLQHFFDGYADSRIIVNDYDTNAIIGSYLFCHVPGEVKLKITHQMPSAENTITWAKLFQRKAAAEAKIIEEEKELNEKKMNVAGTGKLGDEFAIDEDPESDDLEVYQEIVQETNLNGKRQALQSNPVDKSNKRDEDDDDDAIIFEEPASFKKSKLD